MRQLSPLDASFLALIAQSTYKERPKRGTGGYKLVQGMIARLETEWARQVADALMGEVSTDEARDAAVELWEWVKNCRTVHHPRMARR